MKRVPPLSVFLTVYVFEFRICPGRHLSHDMMTLVAASLLTFFKLEPPADAFGNCVKLSLRPSSSFIS